MKLSGNFFRNRLQSMVVILSLTVGCLAMLSMAEEFEGDSREPSSSDRARAAAARFISKKAARAAAARAARSDGVNIGGDEDHFIDARAARAAAMAARAARAAAANSAARPAAYLPNNRDQDFELYWAALNTASDQLPSYKWNRYEARSANQRDGEPKRAGSNRKFQTQGW